MNDFITANSTTNKFMNDYIIQKYRNNITKATNSVHIFPKDYKTKGKNVKRWKVYLFYKRIGENKQRIYERSSININGQDFHINRVKDHKERIKLIELLKSSVINELINEPKFILTLLYGREKSRELYPSLYYVTDLPKEFISIKQAFEESLEAKKSSVGDRQYAGLKSVCNRFLKHIGNNKNDTVDLINKKMLVGFIDAQAVGKSNQTRNNIKDLLSSLLSKMKEQEVIEKNYIDNLPSLKTTSKLNYPFTEDELKRLHNHLLKEDYTLYFFNMHIYYGLMRMQTIVRLKVKDIDLNKRVFRTHTKTGIYLKKIGEQLYKEYIKLDLENANPEHYIFCKKKLIGDWNSKDENRRGYYTDLFKPHKDKLFSNPNFTMYSGRHSSALKIYKSMYEKLQKDGVIDYKEKAVEYLRVSMEHKSTNTTIKYLRGISTELHQDFSKYL